MMVKNIYIQDDDIGIDNGIRLRLSQNDALKFVSVLIEWHFSTLRLSKKAKQLNTLPENPYILIK